MNCFCDKLAGNWLSMVEWKNIPPEYEDPNEDHQESINDLDEEVMWPVRIDPKVDE